MTTKDDFDASEWEVLITMPWIAGLLVVVADPSWRLIGEMKAMAEAVLADRPTGAASELISAMVGDMKSEGSTPDNDDDRSPAEMLDLLREGATIMVSRCTAAEVGDVRAWTLDVARATAEARREGGILGIGAERVSDKERVALGQIEAALTTTD